MAVADDLWSCVIGSRRALQPSAVRTMPSASYGTLFRWLFRGRSRTDSGPDRSLWGSSGLTTLARAIHTDREAISRGPPAKRPMWGPPGLDRAPARCHSEPYAAGDVSADTHSGGARRAGSERMISGANTAAGRGPRAPCYEYGLDATPCYSGWCTVRMMSAGVAKVPVVTCTPRLFMLARRQSSTAS